MQCPQCSETFEPKNKRQVCCSASCQKKRTRQRATQNARKRRGGYNFVPCKVCGKSFHASRNAAYCSAPCRSEARKRNYKNYWKKTYATETGKARLKRNAKRSRERHPTNHKKKYRTRISKETLAQKNERLRKARDAHKRRMEDPATRERYRKKRLEWAKKNKEKVRSYGRKYRAALRAEIEMEAIEALTR